MLTPNTETPEVPKTAVGTDLLQSLKIITQLRVNSVRQNLAVLAVDDIALPVQEPCWDLELRGILDNGNEAFQLVRVELSRSVKLVEFAVCLVKGAYLPLVKVDIGLLANQVGVTTTHTLDFGQRVHDLALAIDVGIQKSQNVLFGCCQWIHLVPRYTAYLELLVGLGDVERHGLVV